MEIIEAVGPIPMRIATEIPSVALQDFCDTLSSHAPSLVTVTVPRGTSSAFIFPATFESLPNLRHLHSAPSVLQLNAPPGATVEVANLVALTIGCGHESLRVNHQRWSFPALETLRLWSMDHPEEEARMEGLVTTLRALGKNVRTLELPTSEMEDMPAEVWSLCPKVERLFTSHQVRSIPPPNHPIHTIGIPFVREHHIGYDEWTTYPHIPEFPGLRTVVINNPRAWDMIDEANYLFGYIRDCHSRGANLAAVHVTALATSLLMDVQSTQNDIKPNVSSINGIKDDAHLAPNGQLARMSAATTNLSHPVAVNGADSSKEMSRGDEEVDEWPSLQDLEKELPKVFDGQVYLGFLMHQLVQDLYAQLLNIAETLGRASDTVKKAKLQQWLSLAYKQVSKVYVLAKWSRNADDIQKAMNIA
ncbi:mediator complex subunit, partial [Serendipita sp. 398]